MPLRDHFRPPLKFQRSWEELHGAWPGVIAFRLNTLLPKEYYSGVRVRMGTAVEVDIAAFQHESTEPESDGTNGHGGTALALESQAVLLETETPEPPEYEVLVYDETRTRRLVAAVEIVSPRNNDRAEARDAFVSKCHALLQQGVCVWIIVDPVTERGANLYTELAARLGAEPPLTATGNTYAVSLRTAAARGKWRVEAWAHDLTVGAPLPTLPLWLADRLWVPLELELTYEDTCRGLRIA